MRRRREEFSATAGAGSSQTHRRPEPGHPHDSSYKLLLSHPAMVADLLTGFVHEEWVAELDFATLEKYPP